MDSKDSKKQYLRLPAAVEEFYPEVVDASTLTLAIDAAQYSASVIARAVEDCDAHLLNLNVGSLTTVHGEKIVYLRINHRNAAAVARSVERFGYRVISINNATDDDTDTARERVNELLRYLEI